MGEYKTWTPDESMDRVHGRKVGEGLEEGSKRLPESLLSPKPRDKLFYSLTNLSLPVPSQILSMLLKFISLT